METASYPSQLSNDRHGRVLDIVWNDGATQQLPHLLLRARCKCTVCQSQRLLAEAAQLTPPAQQADVHIDDIRQIGLYGVQLVFSDGHERGIYPWAYLRELGFRSP
jgi:DUF971 family protein